MCFDGRDCVSMVVETCLVGQRRDRLPMMALCFCFFLVLSGISTWRGGGATKGSNALFSSYIRISVAVLPCGGDFITWYVYILFRESSLELTHTQALLVMRSLPFQVANSALLWESHRFLLLISGECGVGLGGGAETKGDKRCWTGCMCTYHSPRLRLAFLRISDLSVAWKAVARTGFGGDMM